MIIAPSLLSANFLCLRDDLQALNQTSAKWLHLDIMDGHFVPNISFGFPVIKDLAKETNLFLDCHLMISPYEPYLVGFKEAGVHQITIHIEAGAHSHRGIQLIKQMGLKAGVALNPGTAVESLMPILHDVDTVLVMSVNPGFGGQVFINSVLSKIEWLSRYRSQHHLNFLIEVDGGINQATAKLCVQQGADVLVAGNYMFESSLGLSVAQKAELFERKIQFLNS